MSGAIMAAEMAEQPERLAELIGRRAEIAELVAPQLAGIVGTVVVARGSSDHAATVGRYLLEMSTGRPVSSASPSIQTLYDVDMDFEGFLVIAVSQSGRTPEITRYLTRAAARGARTIAVTNDAASPLARASEVVVDLRVGDEQAVPATKTVTAEIVGFALIGAAGGRGPAPGTWAALPGAAADVLADVDPVRELASWLAETQRLLMVARGPMSGAAHEAALKLQETCSLPATAYSAADLRHGPISVAGRGTQVMAMAHPGPAAPDVMALADELADRGGDVRLLGPFPGAACGWAPTMAESLAPVLGVLRGQQLAYELARLRGVDPDHPAGLTKVTVT